MEKLYEQYFKDNRRVHNEFIVFPAIMAIWSVYKKYYSKAAKYCIARGKIRGKEKQVCLLRYKILSIKHAKTELIKYKEVCRKYSTNVKKCLNEVDNQSRKLDKELRKTERKLAVLIARMKKGRYG